MCLSLFRHCGKRLTFLKPYGKTIIMKKMPSSLLSKLSQIAIATSIVLGAPLSMLVSTSAQAQAAAVYTDLWWNAAEEGWGINLNHQNDIIFGTWFTYMAGNTAGWYVMSDLRRQADGSFTGAIYQTTGTPFSQITGTKSSKGVTAVGNATLRFSASNAGTFTYTVNGTTQSKSITRQQYTPVATSCSQQAASTARATSQNYQDLWWVPAEEGWGVNLTHQGDILFATLFTYAASGAAQWVVASSVARQSDGSYTGKLYRTTGTAFNLINGTKSSQSVAEVGSITLRFSNGENGVMTYTLDGASGTKNISRQVFGSTVNVCTNPSSTTGSTPPINPVSGSCLSYVDFATGNTYVTRSNVPATNTFGDSQVKVIGPGTYQGRPVIIVENRGMTNGVPDAVNYTYTYYEDRGATSGVIAAETFSPSGKSLTTYDPVDYAPKVFTVGQGFGGTYTATTVSNQGGFTTNAKTVYTYAGSVVGTENVTVPAGNFTGTCKTVFSRISTRTTFEILGLPTVPGLPSIGGYDFTCDVKATGNNGAIGTVKSVQENSVCSGTFAPNTTPPTNAITSELIRATVNGRSYP
jgi:hypothetical protein